MDSSNNKVADKDTELTKKSKKRNALYWITFILFIIVLIIVYIILRFQRTSEEFPFFQTADLKESTMFLPSHLFNQITFFLSPAQRGKTMFLNNLTKLLIKAGRLAVNIDANFGEFSSPDNLLLSLKNGLITSFSEIKPYLTKEQIQALNEINSNIQSNNKNSKNAKNSKNQKINAKSKNFMKSLSNSIQIPKNLHPALVPFYSQTIEALNIVISTISNNASLSLKAFWNFIDILESTHKILGPVLIIQNADYLIESNLSYVASYLIGKLSRQSEYESNIPFIFELHDSRLLHEPFSHNPLNFYPLLLQKANSRIVRSGKLNNNDIKYLVQNSYFRRYEARKIQKTFGKSPSQFAVVFENLLLGDDITTAINREQNRINQQVSLMMKNTPKTGLLKTLCRGKSNFDQDDLIGLDNLLRYGLLWIDDAFKLHFANKGVKNAICS